MHDKREESKRLKCNEPPRLSRGSDGAGEANPFLGAGRDELGWGRAFDWKEVFARHSVKMCFHAWDSLKWLPNSATCRSLSLQSLLEDEAFAYAAHTNFISNEQSADGRWELPPRWTLGQLRDVNSAFNVRGSSTEERL
ncbi:hypothetical protein Efla_005022 [Eimeria flavescens]